MDNFYTNASRNQSEVPAKYFDSKAIYVLTCAVISISLPLNLVAIYALHLLVQKDHVAPIYVINLLVSDLIQLCSMVVRVLKPEDPSIVFIFFKTYFFALMVSVGFMVCIALERYLVLVCPLWYRFRRTVRNTLVVCVVVWLLPLVIITADFFWGGQQVSGIIFGVFVLIPYPLLIFFLRGTLKALSSARRVPANEKQRIVGLLVLVLLIYTLLFLPPAIWCLEGTVRNSSLSNLSFLTIKFSPLADLFMYVFLRKGAVDEVLAAVCWRMSNSTHETSRADEPCV